MMNNDRKPKGLIYKVRNKYNGKVYMGITTKTVEERKADHIHKAKKGMAGYFQEAIGTHSPKAFLWEQIHNANNINDLAIKE